MNDVSASPLKWRGESAAQREGKCHRQILEQGKQMQAGSPWLELKGQAWGRSSEARDLAGRACGREGTFLKPAVVRDPALQVYLEVPPL